MRVYRLADGFWGLGAQRTAGGHWFLTWGTQVLTTEPGDGGTEIVLPKKLRTVIWLLDEVLDRFPGYWDRDWHRYGQWGCQLGLHHLWDDPEEQREEASR